MPAALAAEAAREQGKFWEMHDKLFANQQALDRADLEKYAQELGLDMDKFKAALDKEKDKERIKQRHGRRRQVRRARHADFFINGRNFRGAQPFEAFKSVIDEEIKKADAKIAARHAARQALRRAHRGAASTRRPRRRPAAAGRARRQHALPGRASRARRSRAPRTRRSRSWSSPTSSARSAAASSRPSTR